MATAKKDNDTADPKEMSEKLGVRDMTEDVEANLDPNDQSTTLLGQADFTGVPAAPDSQETAAETQAIELALANRGVALHAARAAGVFPVVVSDPKDGDDVKIEGVEGGSKKIRVRNRIDNMAFGAWTGSFEEGKEYNVPEALAAHLEEKGVLWHG